MGNVRLRLASAFVVGIVIIIRWTVYINFGIPDSNTILMTRATNSARRAMIEQDWESALNVLTEANETAEFPDWELLTWYAVLLEKTGVTSDAIVEQAINLTRPDNMWITFGMVAILANEPPLALKAGQALIDLNVDSVQGYFLVAQAYDIQDELETALQYYELTIDKIDQVSGHEGIYITVRQRIAQINIELMEQEVICC